MMILQYDMFVTGYSNFFMSSMIRDVYLYDNFWVGILAS